MSIKTKRNRIFSIYGIVIVLLSFHLPQFALSKGIPDPVLVDSTFSLYQSGDMYLSGQPTEENLKTLFNEGVKLVINVRTVSEMTEYGKEHYDEAGFIKGMNIEYLQTGVGGADGYKPEVIKAISEKIAGTKGKVLIHCAAAGRATLIWMAWLVANNQCSIDEAMRLGKKAKFTFPLGDLLGFPVTVERAK